MFVMGSGALALFRTVTRLLGSRGASSDSSPAMRQLQAIAITLRSDVGMGADDADSTAA